MPIQTQSRYPPSPATPVSCSPSYSLTIHKRTKLGIRVPFSYPIHISSKPPLLSPSLRLDPPSPPPFRLNPPTCQHVVNPHLMILHFLTPSFQSRMCSLMIRAAASALCCRPIASTKSPSGSTSCRQPQAQSQNPSLPHPLPYYQLPPHQPPPTKKKSSRRRVSLPKKKEKKTGKRKNNTPIK